MTRNMTLESSKSESPHGHLRTDGVLPLVVLVLGRSFDASVNRFHLAPKFKCTVCERVCIVYRIP